MTPELAPPPAIDPGAPMIARTERIAVARPAAAAFTYVVRGPLEGDDPRNAPTASRGSRE